MCLGLSLLIRAPDNQGKVVLLEATGVWIKE